MTPRFGRGGLGPRGAAGSAAAGALQRVPFTRGSWHFKPIYFSQERQSVLTVAAG